MTVSIFEKPWFNGKNKRIINPIVTIKEATLEHPDVMVRIGTDAQKIGNHVDFVTVVCVHFKGNGGKLFYTKTRADNHGDMSLFNKLAQETMLSLEAAITLEQELTIDKNRIEVHADANPDPKWKSHSHHKQIQGMIFGQGFHAVLKPYSWVSTHAADRIVKNKHLDKINKKRVAENR